MWISVIGSIASIISLMISLYRENKNVIKIFLIICFVFFTSLSIYIENLHSKIKVRENIEKSALLLIRDKQTLSYEGFVYAGLSFLESNKGLYQHYGFDLMREELITKTPVMHYSMIRYPKGENDDK